MKVVPVSNSGAVSEQTSMILLFSLYFFATLMNVPLYQVIMMHSDGLWSALSCLGKQFNVLRSE
jgi:hypothetical protein